MAGAEVRKSERCIEAHTAMIFDRGGARRLWQLVDVAQVRWSRKLDGQSTADLTITGEACRDQADVLGMIEPRRHELVLFRNGERVWEGPIVQVAWFRDRATLLAHDVTEYLRYTTLSKRWPNVEEGGQRYMLDRVREIIGYELTEPYTMTIGTGSAMQDVVVPRWEGLDPPANILPFLQVRDGGVRTRSVTEAFELSLYEHIQNLAQGGMDFTAIGRRIMFWDRAESIGQTRTVTDSDFYGDVEVFASGSDHWSIEHVVAQPVEDGTTPPGPEAHEVVVLRENLFKDPKARTRTDPPWGMDYTSYGAAHTYTTITDPDGTTWFQMTYVETRDWFEFLFKATMQPDLKYRFRCRVRCPVAVPVAQIRISHTGGSSYAQPVNIPLPAGESIIDVTMSFENDALSDSNFHLLWEGDGDQNRHEMQGKVLQFTEVLIERARTSGPYFDGDTPDTDEFTYRWTGAPNASTSVQEGEKTVTDGDPLAVGSAGGEHPFYGVWTHVTSMQNEEGTTEPSQEELNSQASRELVGRTPVPVEIRVPSGAGIKPSFDLTIADLVPGVEVPVLATFNLRKISQMQRIKSVTVTETSTREEVGVTLEPFGDVTGVTDG